MNGTSPQKSDTPAWWHDAEYRREALPDDNGNPLLLALPSFSMRERDVLETYSRYPSFDVNERQLPASQRLGLVGQVLDILHGQSQHVHLFIDIHLHIRNGYRHKRPDQNTHLKLMREKYRNSVGTQVSGPICDVRQRTSVAMSLLGLSGLGKSEAVRRCLSYLPQVIRHPGDVPFFQIPYLYVECPPHGSLRQLSMAILTTLGRVLDVDYTRLFSRKTGSEMLHAASQAISYYNVGILVFDECQNLLSYKEARDTIVRDLVAVSNSVDVPTVFVGTPDATRLFSACFASARRAGPATYWFPMEAPSSDANDFSRLCEAAWNFQWVRRPVPLDPDILRAWFAVSQGIPAIMMLVFAIAQKEAIKSGSERVSGEQLLSAYEENLPAVAPLMNQLKTGSPDSHIVARDLWSSRYRPL